MGITKKQEYWRKRIFVLTWLGYAAFYFGRKNLSVTWVALEAELGFENSDYAGIIFVYSLVYTLGQFLNGYLSDAFGPRRVVTMGLLLAAVGNLMIGLSFSLGVVVFLIGLNGYGQSTGWSGLVKNMTPWFRKQERGVVMSWWSTCYVIGGFLATVFATYAAFDMEFLSEWGWKRGFIFPAIILGIVAVVYGLFTRNDPQEAGVPRISEDGHDEIESDGQEEVVLEKLSLLKILLGNSSLWIYSASYFILKMTRYAFLFWLPIYLEKSLQYGASEAGYISSTYELVGFLGVILAGYSSDKLFKSKRFSTIAIMMILLGLACLVHPYMVEWGKWTTLASISLIGMATYGPDSLISTAGAMDVGGKEGAGMAAGIINGVGSIGQMFSGYVVVAISDYFGWNSLFYFFVIISFIGGGLAALKWNYLSPEN